MSLTLIQMRALLRTGLGGLSNTELINADADLYLNMGLWELSNNYPFEETETLFTATLVDGQGEYQLPSSIVSLHSVALIDDQSQRQKLDRMTRDWYDLNYNSSVASRGTPEKYMREDTFLILNPDPNTAIAGNTLSITVLKDVASLVSGSNDATGLPRNWDELVVKAAITKGHYFNEDYSLARESHNFVVTGVRDAVPTLAKEERDSRFAGLDVAHEMPRDRPGAPRPFGSEGTG